MITVSVYSEEDGCPMCITSCEYCGRIITFSILSPPICKKCGNELPPLEAMLSNLGDRIDYFIYNGDE